MALSERQLLDALSRMPFIDSMELAGILGEAHATVHRALSDLMADDIVGRISHGTAHLPSKSEIPSDRQRHPRGRRGSRLCDALGLRARLPRVQGMADAAHPQDGRGCCRLPTRRLDVPRHRRATLPVEFHRRGRLDATITLHDSRSFGIVRQGLALRRRSLYDRLRAIAEYDYTRRPAAVLVLTAERLGGKAHDEVLRGPEPP